MLTVLTVNNSAGEPIAVHENVANPKRLLISVKGLVGVGALRAAKRVRPTAHGAINQTKYEDGRVITLEGEVMGATPAEAYSELSAMITPWVQTVDVGAALMKWEEPGGRKLQRLVKLDGEVEPIINGIAPRLVYQAPFFAEDPRAYSQTQTTAKGSGLTGAAQEGEWLKVPSGNARNVCVDASHIYWCNRATSAIGRAAIGGTAIEPEWVKTARVPQSIAVDSGHVYWGTDSDGNPLGTRLGVVGRATIAGATVENEWLPVKATNGLVALAVNASNIFWAAGRSIGRATIAGGSSENPWLTLEVEPYALALNGSNIFFGWGNGIGRATLAGAELNANWMTGTGFVTGLAVDATYVYWLLSNIGWVGRAKLAGTEPEPAFIVAGAKSASGLAANTEHLYWGESTGYIARSKELAAGGPVGSNVTVAQAGNRPSPVIFKVAGTIHNAAIIRKSDGSRLSFSGTIESGNYMEVDTQKRTVLLNGASNLLSFLEPQASNWEAFQAPSSPGTEIYQLTGNYATGATLEVIYRSAYA
ncbi:MAG TPA: hypothetical protein VGN08_13580 [Solirubrobacteraceae bacterium]|jgi:hypothetical protein